MEIDSNKITKKRKFPENEDLLHTFSLCEYFADYKQPLGRYTYIVYKEAKIKWIEQQEKDLDRKLTQDEKNNHVRKLSVDTYNEYVQQANDYIQKDLQSLVEKTIASDIESNYLKGVVGELNKDISEIKANGLDFVESIFVGVASSALVSVCIGWVNSIVPSVGTRVLLSIITVVLLVGVYYLIKHFREKNKK